MIKPVSVVGLNKGLMSFAGATISKKQGMAKDESANTNSFKAVTLKAQNLKAYAFPKLNFTGKPDPLPPPRDSSYTEIERQWKRLREHKYSDVHSDLEHPEYKNIRLKNYSFLKQIDEMTKKDFLGFPKKKEPDYMRKFIETFCETTGFPDVQDTSLKIRREFKRALRESTEKLNEDFNCNNFDVVCAGFDPTSSVGLGYAYPGSDLDKAYVILKGDIDGLFDDQGSKKYHHYISDSKTADYFKGALWEITDQRLLSFNHRDSFPEIMTYKDFMHTLDILDKYADELIKENGWKYYQHIKDTEFDNLEKVASFNIDIAQKIGDYNYNITKEKAKNFAFVLEPLLVNDAIESLMKADLNGGPIKFPRREEPALGKLTDKPALEIARRLQKSNFAKYSNVTRIKKLRQDNEDHVVKSKGWKRRNFMLECASNINKIPYSMVADVVKYASEDQDDPHYDKFYANDKDIGAEYRELVKILTKKDS